MTTLSSPRYTFKKEERLTRKKLMDELFNNGSSFYLLPFKVLLLETSFESLYPVQILISVPSKNFPRAVDRNKIKRLIREAYRMNKDSLYSELERKNKKLLLAYIYSSKKMETFSVIQEKVIVSLQKIISQL